MHKKILFFISAISLVLGIGCSKPLLTVKETRLLLGTVVNITVNGETKRELEFAVNEAFGEIAYLETILSRYNKESDIYKINNLKNKTKPIKVHRETFELIKKSIELGKLSRGAFDITCLPILELWGFGNKAILKIPDEKRIKATLKNVGFDKIVLDEEKETVSFLNNSIKIDLGGIAKGYAVDRAIAVLRKRGIKSAIVDAGGDLYCLGGKVNNLVWSVGIQHPRDRKKLVSKIELNDKAVATSGDYERFVIIEEKKYSHIVNPKTGYPIEGVPMSVTIIAKDCTTADALSTAIFVLGAERGLKLLNSLQDTSGIIISRSNPDGYIVDLTDDLNGKINFKF
ncbi:MAG: FAD:protein FMN transferase [Candidatus Omnitrophica bacterium]|nr:FAD:protein FMN transferase [Candidatus Omnitrophota bacterium]